MPRDSSGVYTLPPGNPVITDTDITSDWGNTTMSDIGNTLTESLDRQGRGGMLTAFNIVDGTLSQPGLRFGAEVGSGMYRSGTGSWWLTALATQIANVRSTSFDIKVPTSVAGLLTINTGGLSIVSGGAIIQSGGLNATGTATFNNDVAVTGALTKGGVNVVTEAPIDGTTYGRKDAVWATLPVSVVPSDLTGMIAWRHSAGGKWLQLNGQSVSKTTYAALWAYAQNFLTADQATNPGLYVDVDASNFALPVLSGMFIRGLGTGPGTGYISGALGARQNDAMQDHIHGGVPGITLNAQGGSNAVGNTNTGFTSSPQPPARLADETRPANVALVPCVFAG
jgi:hypothetical protein